MRRWNRLLDSYIEEYRARGVCPESVAMNTARLDRWGRWLKARRPRGAHALRATAATNALDHDADIAKVQEWLGHANIATTRIYDRRKMKPEDSPTFKVSY
jgi:integrase